MANFKQLSDDQLSLATGGFKTAFISVDRGDVFIDEIDPEYIRGAIVTENTVNGNGVSIPFKFFVMLNNCDPTFDTFGTMIFDEFCSNYTFSQELTDKFVKYTNY